MIECIDTQNTALTAQSEAIKALEEESAKLMQLYKALNAELDLMKPSQALLTELSGLLKTLPKD